MSRRRPVLLDLYCGRGGAAMGYYRAGFDVVGVDIAPQPYYPFDFIQADAIEYTLQHGHEYDARHASPTCTGYSRGTAAVPDRLARYDRLIGATREALQTVGGPYVIENVADARHELHNPVMLCWSMFRDAGSVLDADGTPLRMERHRLFETNVPLGLLPGCYHPSRVQVAGAYSGARRDRFEARHVRKGGYVPPTLDVLRELLGTPWMDEKGCFLSVPPDYTEWIGAHVLDALDSSASLNPSDDDILTTPRRHREHHEAPPVRERAARTTPRQAVVVLGVRPRPSASRGVVGPGARPGRGVRRARPAQRPAAPAPNRGNLVAIDEKLTQFFEWLERRR